MAAFPLQSLLDHSRHRLQAAERLLQMLKRKEETARQRLEELEKYRREYRERLTGSSQGGVDILMLRDFHAFLAKIEVAIGQQRENVAQLYGQWQSAQDNWLALRQRVKAYEVLSTRHAEAETRRQSKREQSQSDEQVGRKVAARILAEKAEPSP